MLFSNDDILFRVVSFLDSKALLNLALTCTRCGIAKEDCSWSLAEELARQLIRERSSEWELKAVVRVAGQIGKSLLSEMASSGVEWRHLNLTWRVRLASRSRFRNSYRIQEWTTIGNYERCESCLNINAIFYVSLSLTGESCYSPRDYLVNTAGRHQSWPIIILVNLESNKAFASKERNFLPPNHDSVASAGQYVS